MVGVGAGFAVSASHLIGVDKRSLYGFVYLLSLSYTQYICEDYRVSLCFQLYIAFVCISHMACAASIGRLLIA